jgi:hypothetical protein
MPKTWDLGQGGRTWRPGKNRNLVKFGYTTHPLKENLIGQRSF